MNVVGEEVIEPPYAIHFSSYFKHEDLENSIFGYDKYYKEFKDATIGHIPTFKILCIDYKGYKLARFMDKNVSISCTEQLLICLRELCLRKLREENLEKEKEIQIPVESIIELVQEDFGFILPYLILKRSKRIKKVKFEKLLDENYKIQDTITVKISNYLS